MRPKNNQTLALTTLAAVLLAAFANGAAAAEKEEVDPVALLTTPDSSVSIGIGHVSGEREQFGIYDDVRDNETMLLLDADVNKRDDETGTWMTLKARNLGIDNRSIELGYERQGDWGIGLDYSQIPRISPYTVNSGITGLGSEMQTVPNVGYIPGTGKDIKLGTERERIGLNFFKHLSPNLSFKISFRNEEKDGDRHWGRGGQPEFAAEPIDATNRTLDAILNYAGKKLQLSGGYIGNWYDNHNDLVTTTNGSNTYNLSLPFDSQAHKLFLNGGYSFTPTTRGTFRLSYTHATVDESIPAAIAALAWDGTGANPRPGAAAAPSGLDGAINTTVVFLGLTSRPMNNFSWVANLRYHKVNETTPDDLIVCRDCDDNPTSDDDLVHSTPLDYETLSGKLEGTYRLPKGYSLIGGIDYRSQDRTVPFGVDNDGDGLDDERYVPFRADVDEMTYRLQLRKSMSETVNGSLALLHSRRDGSSYAPAVHSFDPNDANPEPPAVIDPLNISDRERNKLRATVDWSPTDRASLQFNYEIAHDDYSGNTFGLRDGKAQLFSVDGAFRLNEDWQLTGWVSYDRNRAKQNNWRDGNGGGGPIYTNFSEAWLFDTLTDTGTSAGLGLEGKVNSKLKMGADFEWTRTKSQYDQDIITVSGSGGPLYYPDTVAPLDDIRSTVTRLQLFGEYAIARNADLRFDLVHERWKTNDWTWQFSDGTPFTYGSTRDGTMVINDPNQSSTFVGARYIYKFH